MVPKEKKAGEVPKREAISRRLSRQGMVRRVQRQGQVSSLPWKLNSYKVTCYHTWPGFRRTVTMPVKRSESKRTRGSSGFYVLSF